MLVSLKISTCNIFYIYWIICALKIENLNQINYKSRNVRMTALKISLRTYYYKADLTILEEPASYEGKKIVSSKIIHHKKYDSDGQIVKIIFDYNKIMDEKNVIQISLIECGCKMDDTIDQKSIEVINPINCINCKKYIIQSLKDLSHEFIKFLLYRTSNNKPNHNLEIPLLVYYLLNKRFINIISRKISAVSGKFSSPNIRDLWIVENNGNFSLVSIIPKLRKHIVRNTVYELSIDKLNVYSKMQKSLKDEKSSIDFEVVDVPDYMLEEIQKMEWEKMRIKNISKGVNGLNFSILNEFISKDLGYNDLRHEEVPESFYGDESLHESIYDQLEWIITTVDFYIKERTCDIMLDLFSNKTYIHFNIGLIKLIVSYISVIED